MNLALREAVRLLQSIDQSQEIPKAAQDCQRGFEPHLQNTRVCVCVVVRVIVVCDCVCECVCVCDCVCV